MSGEAFQGFLPGFLPCSPGSAVIVLSCVSSGMSVTDLQLSCGSRTPLSPHGRRGQNTERQSYRVGDGVLGASSGRETGGIPVVHLQQPGWSTQEL